MSSTFESGVPTPLSCSDKFCSSDADITIRTSDNVDLLLHKWLLGMASGVFKDMVTLGDRHTASTPVEPNKAVVSIAETQAVFETLLQYIYPIPREPIESLDQLSLLIDAAVKYDLAGAQAALAKELLRESYLHDEPLRVYAIAVRYGFIHERTIALKHTIVSDLIDPKIFKARELDFLHVRDYNRLLFSKRQRAEDCIKLIGDSAPPLCGSCRITGCCWWPSFRDTAKPLFTSNPSSDVLSESLRFQVVSKTSVCVGRFHHSMNTSESFIKMLREKIDEMPWEYNPDKTERIDTSGGGN